MEQRPQALVGEAVVILVMFRLCQIERGRGDAAVGFLLHRSHAFAIRRDIAAPAEPEAAGFTECLDQGDRQAARACRTTHRPDAIGDDDEATGLLASASAARCAQRPRGRSRSTSWQCRQRALSPDRVAAATR